MTKYEYNMEMAALLTERASFAAGANKEIFLSAIEGFENRCKTMSAKEASEEITEEEKVYLNQYRALIKEWKDL